MNDELDRHIKANNMKKEYQLYHPWTLNVPLRAGLLVRVNKPIWGGNHRRGFHQVGSEDVWGIISRDSYGPDQIDRMTGECRNGQHTFTVRDRDLEPHLIKGRHAYRLTSVVVRESDRWIWFRGDWVSRAAVQVPGGGSFNVQWEHFAILDEIFNASPVIPSFMEAA